MEDVIKNCSHQIKVAIEFLEKILVPTRQRPEKDELINNLKRALHLCQSCTDDKKETNIQQPSAHLPPPAQDENIYDDSELPDQVIYDDNVTAGGDDIYEDNVIGGEDVYEDNIIGGEDNSQIYEDNVIGGNNGEDLYEDSVIGDPASSTPTHGEQAACEDLTNIRISSLLEYKKHTSILKSSWCKRWCVISDEYFYIYDSAKDKKPRDCFSLKTYNVDANDGISKETKRKGRCFILRSDLSNKTYEFCASDTNSMLGWKQQIEFVNPNNKVEITCDVTTEETYNDVVITPNDRTIHEGNVQMKKKESLFQSWIKRWLVLKLLQIDIYEISKDGSKKYKSKFSIENCTVIEGKKNHFTVQDKDDTKRYLELCAPNEEDYKIWTDKLKKMFGDDVIPEDIYDDTIEVPADNTAAELIYDDTDGQTAEEQIYDDAEGIMASEDIYDDVSDQPEVSMTKVDVGRGGIQQLPSSNLPSTDTKPPAFLPPTPTTPAFSPPTPTIPAFSPPTPTTPAFSPPTPTTPVVPSPTASNPPLPTTGRGCRIGSVSTATEDSEIQMENDEIDYSSFYQGLWDCPADEHNELSFKRGDLIQIISKEHDCFGWWLGKMEQISGLVPKNYLMTAYEI